MTEKKKTTPKRSALDESPLVNMVEDISSSEVPGSIPASEAEDERSRTIELIMRERLVPQNVAEIMVDHGYSKGTAHRIINDAFKRKTAERERAAGMKA